MQQVYKIEDYEIKSKYSGSTASYRRKLVAAYASGQALAIDAPPKTFDEGADQFVKKANEYSQKAEEKILKMGEALERKLEQYGVQQKIENLFGRGQNQE